MRPTSPAALTAFLCVGLVGGWALHPVSVRLVGVAPRTGWIQVLVLVVAAAALGQVAWTTWRQVHVRRRRISARLAVNRLVLARASALVGVLVGGAYGGYALSWIGDPAELAGQRMLHSGLACAAGGAIVVTALLLERACRTPADDVPPVT